MQFLRDLSQRILRRLLRLPVRQRQIFALACLAVIILIIILAFNRQHSAASFVLSSSAFTAGQNLPPQYTCDGENINPPFSFSKLPANTKSLALLMEDMTMKDHPVDWIAWNIPAATEEILEGIRPAGTVARSFAGNFGYSGPCPPAGEEHTYQVHLYALKVDQLEINSSASISDFQDAIKKSSIGEAKLTAKYQREAKQP